MAFGTRTIGTSGKDIRISADGEPEWKAGGMTIDWTTVTALAADLTLPDGTVVLSGDKYLRYGQVLTQINVAAEAQSLDLSAGADPTAGTFIITVPAYLDRPGGNTASLAYNATAAVVQAALEAVVGIGNVIVTGPASFVYTITFLGALGNMPALSVADITTLTSATSVVVTTTTQGNALGGYYGPYASGASDGRQTLTRGRCFLLDRTIVKSQMRSDQVSGIEGGMVFLQRIVDVSGNPSEANLLTAFPRLRLVRD